MMTLCLLSACNWGVRPSDIAWSRGPSGAPAEVRLEKDRTLITGELLALDREAVLLQTERVIRVPWSAIRTMSLRGLGAKYSLWGGAPPSWTILHQFALVSHFPQGLEPAVLAKLLASRNQTDVEDIQ